MLEQVYQSFKNSEFLQYFVVFSPMLLLAASPWLSVIPEWNTIAPTVAGSFIVFCGLVVWRENRPARQVKLEQKIREYKSKDTHQYHYTPKNEWNKNNVD